MARFTFLLLIILIVGGLGWVFGSRTKSGPDTLAIPSATPTVAAQGNPRDPLGMVILESPVEGQSISSPLRVTGKARGTWFFEASFPIILTDWDGKIIAEGYAQAQGDWMTEDYVPFIGTVTFKSPAYGERGALILKKDNPSGLPQNDAAYEISIRFEK